MRPIRSDLPMYFLPGYFLSMYFLPMYLSSFHGKRRNDCQREIDESQAPESCPIARDLPNTGTQLVGADKPVDREIRGEDATQCGGCGGNCLARPRKSRREE